MTPTHPPRFERIGNRIIDNKTKRYAVCINESGAQVLLEQLRQNPELAVDFRWRDA